MEKIIINIMYRFAYAIVNAIILGLGSIFCLPLGWIIVIVSIIWTINSGDFSNLLIPLVWPGGLVAATTFLYCLTHGDPIFCSPTRCAEIEKGHSGEFK